MTNYSDRIQSLTRRSLTEEVTEQLRDLIISGELPLGTPLAQTELAEALGVSRTPLREAIRILQRDGLITMSQRGQLVEVRAFDTQELRNWFEVREIIDGLAATRLARNGIPMEARELVDRALDGMARYIDGRADLSTYLSNHVTFHQTLLEECGNERLIDLKYYVRFTAQALYSVLPHDPAERIPKTLVEHRAIYNSILEGQPDAAELHARQHVRNAAENWLGGA